MKMMERTPKVCKAVIKAKRGYYKKSLKEKTYCASTIFSSLHNSICVFFHSFDVSSIHLYSSQ